MLLWIIVGFVGGLIVGWVFFPRPKFVDDFMAKNWPTYKID